MDRLVTLWGKERGMWVFCFVLQSYCHGILGRVHIIDTQDTILAKMSPPKRFEEEDVNRNSPIMMKTIHDGKLPLHTACQQQFL